MKLSKTVIVTMTAFGLGLIMGVATATSSPAAAPQTKTVTVTKTPDSCIDALTIDNQIFTKLGDALGSYSNTIVFAQKLNSTSDYMDAVLTKRSDLFVSCVEGK